MEGSDDQKSQAEVSAISVYITPSMLVVQLVIQVIRNEKHNYTQMSLFSMIATSLQIIGFITSMN